MPDAASDPASLDRLHDIVVPEPVTLWWPPAPGGWVLLGILLLVATWVLFRIWQTRRANAYRRRAIEELTAMTDIRRLPELLKRTALSAYPRNRIAPLTGDHWLAFLNECTPTPCFQGDVGEALKTIQYSPNAVTDGQKTDLKNASRKWIERHRWVTESKSRKVEGEKN